MVTMKLGNLETRTGKLGTVKLELGNCDWDRGTGKLETVELELGNY